MSIYIVTTRPTADGPGSKLHIHADRCDADRNLVRFYATNSDGNYGVIRAMSTFDVESIEMSENCEDAGAASGEKAKR